MVKRKNRISLIVQAGTLKSTFPKSEVKRNKEESLIWISDISPTPLSDTYRLKLHYVRDKGVKVYVIDPKPLALAKGKKFLPHVYSTPKQQLCLYYPNGIEWNIGMLYTKTLIPWACEWLYQYEIWVATGTWQGGGIHHETEAEKQTEKKKEILNEDKKKNTVK
jgi:hypothetical protein